MLSKIIDPKQLQFIRELNFLFIIGTNLCGNNKGNGFTPSTSSSSPTNPVNIILKQIISYQYIFLYYVRCKLKR